MTYLKIGNYNFSHCVNTLEVATTKNYSALTNAAGNTVIDYINEKRAITVGIIPLNETDMKDLLAALSGLSVTLTILNPATNELEEIACYIPENIVSYYTIQPKKILFNTLTLTFNEL